MFILKNAGNLHFMLDRCFLAQWKLQLGWLPLEFGCADHSGVV